MHDEHQVQAQRTGLLSSTTRDRHKGNLMSDQTERTEPATRPGRSDTADRDQGAQRRHQGRTETMTVPEPALAPLSASLDHRLEPFAHIVSPAPH